MAQTIQYLICPFDSSHRTTKAKMYVHIQKCKLNYPDSNLQECKYNKLHWINFSMRKNHQKNCPDRFYDINQSKQPNSFISQIQIKRPKQKLIIPQQNKGLWKQPDFKQWYTKNLNRGGTNKIHNSSDIMDSQSQSLFALDYQRL